MAASYSEDALIEQPTIELFRSLKWEAADCFHEFEHPGGRVKRYNFQQPMRGGHYG
jgi:hypothetical protein